jgi:hypothetical protein
LGCRLSLFTQHETAAGARRDDQIWPKHGKNIRRQATAKLVQDGIRRTAEVVEKCGENPPIFIAQENLPAVSAAPNDLARARVGVKGPVPVR